MIPSTLWIVIRLPRNKRCRRDISRTPRRHRIFPLNLPVPLFPYSLSESSSSDEPRITDLSRVSRIKLAALIYCRSLRAVDQESRQRIRLRKRAFLANQDPAAFQVSDPQCFDDAEQRSRQSEITAMSAISATSGGKIGIVRDRL